MIIGGAGAAYLGPNVQLLIQLKTVVKMAAEGSMAHSALALLFQLLATATRLMRGNVMFWEI